MAGWDQVLANYAQITRSDEQGFWQDYLTEHPDALYALLADLYAASQTTDRPPTLDDLWDLVGPRFTNEPFGVAVKELLGKRSVRWLATQIHMHNVPLARMLNGEREVVSIRDPKSSMARIEVIARALRVHPSYFAEWRRLWVMSLLDAAFAANPNLSMGVYRKFAGHEDRKSKQNGR